MKTPEYEAIERAIKSQSLIEISQALFARINPVPKVLQKGEGSLPENAILYASVDNARALKLSGIVSLTYNERPKENYDGNTRQKFWPIVENLEQELNDNYLTTLIPTTIYCAKTGQPIGAIDNAILYDAHTLYGNEGLKDYLYTANINAVHLTWRNTSPEMLDKLAEHFPAAVCSYLLGLITKPQFVKNRNDTALADHHWSLARTYQLISQLSQNKLVKLVELLSSFTSYLPYSLTELQNITKAGPRLSSPDYLARRILQGDLVSQIEIAINRAILSAQNFFSASTSRDWNGESWTDNARAKSPSQVKAMELAKAYHRMKTLEARENAKKLRHEEKQAQKLADAKARLGGFADHITNLDTMPGNEPWRRLMAKPTTPTRDAALSSNSPKINTAQTKAIFTTNDLLFFAQDLSFDDTPASKSSADKFKFGNAGDNVPEMRRISFAELKARDAEIKKEIQAKLDATPELGSLLSRMSVYRKASESEPGDASQSPSQSPSQSRSQNVQNVQNTQHVQNEPASSMPTTPAQTTPTQPTIPKFLMRLMTKNPKK